MKRADGLLVVLLIAANVMMGCGSASPKERPPRPVKAKSVELISAHQIQRYSASIKANNQVDVAFKVAGYVEMIPQVRGSNGGWRYLQEGDVVTKGTVLARIRPTDYAAKVAQAKSQLAETRSSLQANQAQLADARAALAMSQKQVIEAQAGYEKARLDFERSEKLFATQSLTKTDYDAAKAQLDSNEARLGSAKDQVTSMKAKVLAAENQIGIAKARIKTAEATTTEASIPLEDATLRAPISGVLLQRKIEVGTLAAQGTAAYTLADTTSVKAVFGVADLSINTIRLGETLAVASDAIPGEEFSGHVSAISPSADPNSRVFQVEVVIPNPQNKLRVGMIASLQVGTSGEAGKVSVVPLSSIVRAKDGTDSYAVFVIENQAGKQLARLRSVKLGDTYGNAIATTGVTVGEQVITSGAQLVSDGEAVQVAP